MLFSHVGVSQSEYDNLPTKYDNTVYLINSSGKAYLGSNQITSTFSPAEETVANISVLMPPTKIEYNAGEALDLTGLTIQAHYIDAHTADCTSLCTFSPTNGSILTTADEKVTITYLNNTTIQLITVS